MSDINFTLYLKFYETKIESIANWKHVFESVKGKSNVTIYVWIESLLNTYSLLKKYKILGDYMNAYHFIIVTQENKGDYYDCSAIENKIRYFIKDVGLNFQIGDLESDSGVGHIYAHLRSFLIPKDEYIYHIDGDDIFVGEWLGYNQLYRAVQHMHKTGKVIMTKPFCISVDLGYSFSFLLQRKSLFKKMFIMNPEYLPNGFKKKNFYKKNLDFNKAMNTDNYFGMILIDYYGYEYSDIFFSFVEDPFWLTSGIIRGVIIRGIRTTDDQQINFIKKCNIPILAEMSGNIIVFTYNEYIHEFSKIENKSKRIINILEANNIFNINGYYYIKNESTGLYINPTNDNMVFNEPFKIKINTHNIHQAHFCVSESNLSVNKTKGCYLFTIPFNNSIKNNGDSGLWSVFYLEKNNNNKFYIRIYHYQNELYKPLVLNKYGQPASYLYVHENKLLSDGSRRDNQSIWILDEVMDKPV